MPSNLVCTSCKKTFIYPAHVTEITPSFQAPNSYAPPNWTTSATPMVTDCKQVEYTVCPYCRSLDIQTKEETVPQETVAKVYVYELTTGAQTELDKLLAEGFRIVNRYSKQYHLEKLKETQNNEASFALRRPNILRDVGEAVQVRIRRGSSEQVGGLELKCRATRTRN
jgi:hypothetical protein